VVREQAYWEEDQGENKELETLRPIFSREPGIANEIEYA
jgi:hypothetical protein